MESDGRDGTPCRPPSDVFREGVIAGEGLRTARECHPYRLGRAARGKSSKVSIIAHPHLTGTKRGLPSGSSGGKDRDFERGGRGGRRRSRGWSLGRRGTRFPVR